MFMTRNSSKIVKAEGKIFNVEPSRSIRLDVAAEKNSGKHKQEPDYIFGWANTNSFNSISSLNSTIQSQYHMPIAISAPQHR